MILIEEGPVTITLHAASFGGIIFIAGILLREHKVWIRIKDRINQLWKDRCDERGDNYVPLENGR